MRGYHIYRNLARTLKCNLFHEHRTASLELDMLSGTANLPQRLPASQGGFASRITDIGRGKVLTLDYNLSYPMLTSKGMGFLSTEYLHEAIQAIVTLFLLYYTF